MSWFYVVYHVNRLCREESSYFHNIFVIDRDRKEILTNLFYNTISDNKYSFTSLAIDVTTVDVVFFATAIVVLLLLLLPSLLVWFCLLVVMLLPPLLLMLFTLLLLLIFFNIYLAVDVTTVNVVLFATAIVIVVTVAVALITIDAVSLVVIAVIWC